MENNPILERCEYYVTHKNRLCQMLVKQGNKYCGQHLVHSDKPDVKGKKRIACPLDPKHSCYEHVLQQHLKCCNASKTPDLPSYSLDFNSGDGEEIGRTFLPSISDAKLLETIEKVVAVHKSILESIDRRIRHHSALESELKSEQCGPLARRHLKQNSSLLEILKEEGLLDSKEELAFVEFGAGKGQMTKWIVNSTEDLEKRSFILVDRGSQRFKCDSKLRYTENVKISRLKLDIQHLNLNKVDTFNQENLRFVAHGKHLCGAATDLTLRCLSNFDLNRCAGILIALCCHHRCTWKSYTGRKFFEKVNISPEEFGIILSFSSWAICTAKEAKSVSADHQKDNAEAAIDTAKEIFRNRYDNLNLSVKYREEIGMKAKHILNCGRLEYLRENGLDAELIEYVDKVDTPENVALLAGPCKKD